MAERGRPRQLLSVTDDDREVLLRWSRRPKSPLSIAQRARIVLLAADGLQSSSKGARIRFSGDKRTVIDGPFAETKELVAGFWLWQVKSKEEAIEWVKRIPNPTGDEGEVEIRQVFEADDFSSTARP